MLDLGKLVEKVGVDRDLVFTSISSKDKEVALKLVKRLDELNINHWCMYHVNGYDRNISGDVYTKNISKELSRCCVFIFLMSRNSLASIEVKKELEQIMAMKNNPLESEVKILPIFVDDTRSTEIPDDIIELTHIDRTVIIRRYGLDTSDAEMDVLCNEIKEQYLSTVFENIRQKMDAQRNSHKFTDLLSSCVRNKCTTRSISEDMKASAEVSAETLKELHVLSNELVEYDANTYSCMIIASNLLGTEVVIDKRKEYVPDKHGVKYYYYVPRTSKMECDATFEKIKSFISKTPESRREVTSLIRREFCARNKVDVFFNEMNGMTIKNFMEQYNIEESMDVMNFREFFNSEMVQSYFVYSDEDDIFRVPEEFFAWLNGDSERYSYDSMIEVSYEFIAFVKKFVEMLEAVKENINSVSLDFLRKRFLYLVKFQRLEEWQMGRVPDMPMSESKKLVNYLLDYTAGVVGQSEKKYPHLANWMQFHRDENNNVIDISEDIVEKAYNNLKSIVVRNDEVLKLCYSFALFVEKTGVNGAWYSTGQGMTDDQSDSMVTTFNISRSSREEYDMILDAFSYMIMVNPKAKEVLETTGSELLGLLDGKRGTKN